MARHIAIDLGAHRVKVVVLDGTAQEQELQGVHSAPVPQDEGGLPDIADRLAALDQLLKEHEDWAGRAITSSVWSSQLAALHKVKLPVTKDEEIEQALPFAVEDEVPFELDDMLLPWRRQEDGRLLVTVAPEAPLTELVEGLAAREMNPRSVAIDADVLRELADAEGVTAVIDVGHSHTSIAVVRGDEVVWWRALDTAGRAFTLAIMDALECTYGEAERLKHAAPEREAPVGEHEPTVDEPGEWLPAQALAAVRNTMGLFLAGVRSSLLQAEDELGTGIDQVVLCGGGSKLPDLQSLLHHDLGIPVESLYVPAEPLLDPAMGVAWASVKSLESHAESKVTNLRVGDLAWRSSNPLVQTLISYGGLGLGVFLLVVLGVFAQRTFSLIQQQDQLEADMLEVAGRIMGSVPEGQDPSSVLNLVVATVEAAREEADLLGSDDSNPETMEVLYQISNAFPPHPDVIVDIDELDILPTTISMNGKTDGFAQLDSINSKLQESGLFYEVVSTPGSKDRNDKLEFDINIARTVEGMEGEGN